MEELARPLAAAYGSFGCHAVRRAPDDGCRPTPVTGRRARPGHGNGGYILTRASRPAGGCGQERGLLRFLLDAARDGHSVCAVWRALPRAHTLLNYAVREADLLPFVCDKPPLPKQGMLMPGSHIPILPPEARSSGGRTTCHPALEHSADEVQSQLSPPRAKGTRFVTCRAGE